MITNPDWMAAGSELVQQCAALQTLDERVLLLETLSERLGADLYPAFLQLLCLVEHCGDTDTQQLFTGTLVFGLTTGRLPSGQLPAWGSIQNQTANPFTRARTLGPIEFLCTWYSQATHFPPLTSTQFRNALDSLVRLINHDRHARTLYCHKLLNDARDPGIGVYASSTRIGLEALARCWLRTRGTQQLATVFINSIDCSVSNQVDAPSFVW